MTVYFCEGVHSGGTANRAESVGDTREKSPLLLCIALRIRFIEFEEGNQPSDFAVENVSDRNAPAGEAGRRASSGSPPRATHRNADVEVGG